MMATSEVGNRCVDGMRRMKRRIEGATSVTSLGLTTTSARTLRTGSAKCEREDSHALYGNNLAAAL